MELLNTKSILELEDESDRDYHYKEMYEIIGKIEEFKDYPCALVCKYQDKYHKKYSTKYYDCYITELLSELERFDVKNGVDMYLGDDGYILLLVYGQGYTYGDEYHLITMGVKVIPIDDDRNFVDLSLVIKGIGGPFVSTEQFEETYS